MSDWLKKSLENRSNVDRLKNKTSVKVVDRFDRLANFTSDAWSILSERENNWFEDHGWVGITLPLVEKKIYIIENPGRIRGRSDVQPPDHSLPRYTMAEIKALAGLSAEQVKFLHQQKVDFSGVISILFDDFPDSAPIEESKASAEKANREEYRKRLELWKMGDYSLANVPFRGGREDPKNASPQRRAYLERFNYYTFHKNAIKKGNQARWDAIAKQKEMAEKEFTPEMIEAATFANIDRVLKAQAARKKEKKANKLNKNRRDR